MAQQTAVEWLIEQISEKQPNGFYVIDTLEDVKRIFEKAKQIEKEQITNAYVHGQNNGYMYRDGGSDIINVDQYYNKEYGNEGV